MIAYNDQQFPFSARLVLAEPAALEAAFRWIDGLQAASTTEILPPLQNATEMLSAARGVPYIFLVTDGAVR